MTPTDDDMNEWAAEWAEESRAEGAWLRHAEVGNPGTWAEEDAARAADAW